MLSSSSSVAVGHIGKRYVSVTYICSHAVVVGNTIYVYGTIGLDPKRGGLAPGGIEGEADQVRLLCVCCCL